MLPERVLPSKAAPGARAGLPQPGETFAGKYLIVRVLGEGGMGIVYEAVHRRLDVKVAIKTLLPALLGQPDPREYVTLQPELNSVNHGIDLLRRGGSERQRRPQNHLPKPASRQHDNYGSRLHNLEIPASMGSFPLKP